MSAWQPIETAPKDGTAVWVLCDGQPYIGYCAPPNWLCDKERWFLKAGYRRREAESTVDSIFGCYAVDAQPTHWQPLPEPPAA